MKDIKLFLTDVDGCLTDGGMYYSAQGDEMKRFCVYDGMGLTLLSGQGIRCGILTSETTDIVRNRARKLRLDYLYMGVGRVTGSMPVLRFAPANKEPESLPFKSKLEACQDICQELGITLDNVCYVGDDVNDIDLLSQVGTAACPENARAEIKAIPGIICLKTAGGQGAIRELCDMILKNK